MSEPPPHSGSDERSPSDDWRFVRDALVLQAKLVVGGLVGVVIGPATIAAALLDAAFRSHPPGRRFYQVLTWGRRTEDAIGLYAALDRRGEAPSLERAPESRRAG